MNPKKNKIIEDIEFIINHKDTSFITYHQYKKSYDFVDKKFPEAKIKNIQIYICDKNIFNKLNYNNVYGLYCSSLKAIVIKKDSDIDIEIVIIHELLHYVSDIVNNLCSRKRKNEEDFVLANLIDYLIEKKWEEKDIIMYLSKNRQCKINEAKDFFEEKRNKTNKTKKFRIL